MPLYRHLTCPNIAAKSRVAEVRARWFGHRLRVEVNHHLLHELRYLETAVVHLDSVQESGEEHHRVSTHSHDGLPVHSH